MKPVIWTVKLNQTLETAVQMFTTLTLPQFTGTSDTTSAKFAMLSDHTDCMAMNTALLNHTSTVSRLLMYVQKQAQARVPLGYDSFNRFLGHIDNIVSTEEGQELITVLKQVLLTYYLYHIMTYY